MSGVWANILLIAVFILLGGVFSAAEMALVSLRDSQVRQLATKGSRGKKVASLAANPNRFLSAIQVCITLSGFLSASFGAATLSDDMASWFLGWGMSDPVAHIVALIVVTVIISYFSVVFGELVAKRLAMQRAEAFALALAGFIDVVATLAKPIIWFLGVSTNLVVRLLGGDPKASREEVTEEELRQMVTTSTSLTLEEREIVDDVFAAGERSLREVMVPRTEAEFLDGDMPAYKAARSLETATHSRFPVTGSSVDDIIGFLHIRDLMYLDPTDRSTPIKRLVRPIMSLPDTVRVLHALTSMRRDGAHMAIVRDEYGGTAGIVTLEDLVEELVGEIQDEYDAEASGSIVSASDHIEVDGLTTLEQFHDVTGLILPQGPYDTVAGFWVAVRGELPSVGDVVTATVERDGVGSGEGVPIEMTVTQMDGRRAARIKICHTSRADKADGDHNAEGDATDS
ncbi:MAG: hemolysin family protein [Propionibacteriaceae bacterium]|nr:hemolysin family protein [Propionibacteriaceae bacterium]